MGWLHAPHGRLSFTIATEITPDILILDELYAGGDAAFVEKANVRLDLTAHASGNLSDIKTFTGGGAAEADC